MDSKGEARPRAGGRPYAVRHIAPTPRRGYVQPTRQALGSRDLRAALEFIETAWALAARQAFPPETLAALTELIACDDLGYSDLDRVHRRVVDYVGTDEGDVDDDHDAFWRIVTRPRHPRTRQTHLRHIHEMTELRRTAGTSAQPDDLERLTPREAEILELVAAGLTNAAIAERLWLSPGTVKKHLETVYAKLGVANRAAATVRTTPTPNNRDDQRRQAPNEQHGPGTRLA